MASSGQKKGPDLPNEAEVHKPSASQTSTGDHSIILFSVLYCAPVCAVTHLYIHTHQGFSPKVARSSCGLLLFIFLLPSLPMSQPVNPPPLHSPSTVESTHFFSDHPLLFDVDVNALITKDHCLNSVQLPVEDEESAQEGTPTTHPQ